MTAYIGGVGLGELGRRPAKRRLIDPRPDLVNPTLSELRILAAYADPAGEGTVKDAAYRLGLSESTVKSRLWRLYAKLDVHNAAQAIVALQRRELAGSNEPQKPPVVVNVTTARDFYAEGFAAGRQRLSRPGE